MRIKYYVSSGIVLFDRFYLFVKLYLKTWFCWLSGVCLIANICGIFATESNVTQSISSIIVFVSAAFD